MKFKNLFEQEISAEYKSKVFAQAQFELKKNKAQYQKKWLWILVPSVSVCFVAILTFSNMKNETKMPADAESITTASEAELYENMDLIEELDMIENIDESNLEPAI